MRISDWSSDVCSSDLKESPGAISFDHRAIATHDDGSAVEAVPLREGLVRIEAGRVARSLALYRLPGIGGMERSLAVPGAVNPVGEIPASQHRDRPLDPAPVHVLENASQRQAIDAAKIRNDRTGRASRSHHDDCAHNRKVDGSKTQSPAE